MQEKRKKEDLPIFSGKALEIRFPDMIFMDEHGKKVKKQIIFITFPDWIHDIYIEDEVYKVLGSDLQIGMPISMGGALFPIIDIKEHYYHGVVKAEEHPIGYAGDITNLKKYSFKRIVKKDIDNWVIEEEKSETEFSLSKETLERFDQKDLIKYCLKLQEELDKTTKNLKILQ